MKKFQKRIFSKKMFPKFVPSSHVLVNLPKKTLDLRPLDKILLKNGFLVERSRFFVKFSKVRTARRRAEKSAGGPQNRRYATEVLLHINVTLSYVIQSHTLHMINLMLGCVTLHLVAHVFLSKGCNCI